MISRCFVVLALSAATASAQASKTPAAGAQAPGSKPPAPAVKTQTPATKSVPATRAQTGATKTAPAGPATKTAAAQQTKGQAAAVLVAPEVPKKPPVIMREAFDYDDAGRRDPFFSLLPTAELRPTISDLRLVGILYDESGRRPVAIMRDVLLQTQYRVTTGMTLGRMRVALIRRRAVIFTIEEFGLNRQDSLVLGDTTKARVR